MAVLGGVLLGIVEFVIYLAFKEPAAVAGLYALGGAVISTFLIRLLIGVAGSLS